MAAAGFTQPRTLAIISKQTNLNFEGNLLRLMKLLGTNRRRGRSGPRVRNAKNTFVTKSGRTIRIRRTLAERLQVGQDARAKRKAQRLAGMPKSRVQRFFYRLYPKRLYQYWLSREGGVMALKITGLGIVAGFLVLVGLFAYFRKDLPNLTDISGANIGGSILYYDRTGQIRLWEDYDAVKRVPVPGENIAQVMKDATIAIEDQNFFNHSGFDMRGIARAAWHNAFGEGNRKQGGSTITQQLVKLTQQWTDDQSYARKVKELILAVELERTYTKQEILVGYLNTAPYGDITYGVEAAMQDYFNRSARDITLDEAAFLAAMPQSPTVHSPRGARFDHGRLIARQHHILNLMAEQGFITPAQRDEAKRVDTLAKVQPRQFKYAGIRAPHFALTAKEKLQEFCGETAQCGGWRVTTTLDWEKQQEAERQVARGLTQVRRQGGNSIAFVAQDVRNGHVVALVGGTDFNNPDFGQKNYARAKLPPGSSIKPYNYLALMEHTTDFGAGSVLFDTVGPLEGYPCTNRARVGGNCLHNYDFREPGPLTLRYALGGSRNIPAVKAMLIVGVDRTIQTAERLGLKSGYNCYFDEALTREAPCFTSAGIGDGAFLRLDEHVHAMTTISRNGNRIPQTYILKIEDAAGRTVYEWQPSRGEQVVRAEAAYIVADMLADPRASYMARKPHNFRGHEFSVKTGTTHFSKDGWFMGFSTYYSAGVWVGHHTRQRPMIGFMESMTQPIWTGWMNAIHQGLPPIERPRPPGIQTLPAFVIRNHVGSASQVPSPSTDLFPGWYRQRPVAVTRQTIDIVSNKLATECTPPRARQEVAGGPAAAFSRDPFVGGRAAITERDDVHNCADIKPTIHISAVKSGSTYTIGGIVHQGTHPIHSQRFPGTVNFKLDGRIIRTFTVTSPGSLPSFEFTPDFEGTRALVAEVIDSVLYDGTSQSITLTGNPPAASPPPATE
jgi:membrane peptidoglycan carboxypeptidase